MVFCNLLKDPAEQAVKNLSERRAGLDLPHS